MIHASYTCVGPHESSVGDAAQIYKRVLRISILVALDATFQASVEYPYRSPNTESTC